MTTTDPLGRPGASGYPGGDDEDATVGRWAVIGFIIGFLICTAAVTALGMLIGIEFGGSLALGVFVGLFGGGGFGFMVGGSHHYGQHL